ncbi:MarC family protein [Sediminispirochaeta bajacaliforniensis]|uniref:MarC family protein n=1 Tax=Sediminispirochaeta bajacaliforniensis TaxID=148 RepID=UPI000363583E|nr:MarC family protein [Sediminispirochaeta bajacaliforniensis]
MSPLTLYGAAATLFLIMDPFGNIATFLSVLASVPQRRRKKIIIREMLIALVILMLFLFFGKYILEGMQITEPALSISGGTILFLIAVKMIFPTGGGGDRQQPESEPIVVPLAVPLVAGPSAMAMVILFSTQAPEKILLWLLALLIAWSLSALILISAETLSKLLGPRAIKAIERLMGMILTTMAIQMLLSGIASFVSSL